ncbi:unnamed protein product [Spodoptera exigua]|nr:unnamed protein product [Spodoptera exigua]
MSTAAPLRACALLLCLLAGSQQLSIKEFEVPSAVEVGKDAELKCQYELNAGEEEVAFFIKWWWTPQSGSSYDKKLIYQRIAGHTPETQVRHDNTSQIEIKENDSIVLLNVNPVDSGTYECEVSNIDEIRKHEKLIVYSLVVGPEINYTLVNNDAEDKEDDMLLIECQTEDIAPMPDMSITFQGEKLNVTKSIEDSDNDGFYNIHANATVSTADIDGGEIRCELWYTDLEHKRYVVIESYVAPGRDASSTTELPEDNTTEPDPTHNSLQNYSDDGIRLLCSWNLVTFATVVVYLATFRP